MKGGKAYPEAETQVNIVCVLPFSAEVIAHTFRRPNSAITLCTIESPVSSILYIIIGSDRIFTNFPKKSTITSSLAQVSKLTQLEDLTCIPTALHG